MAVAAHIGYAIQDVSFWHHVKPLDKSAMV